MSNSKQVQRISLDTENFCSHTPPYTRLLFFVFLSYSLCLSLFFRCHLLNENWMSVQRIVSPSIKHIESLLKSLLFWWSIFHCKISESDCFCRLHVKIKMVSLHFLQHRAYGGKQGKTKQNKTEGIAQWKTASYVSQFSSCHHHHHQHYYSKYYRHSYHQTKNGQRTVNERCLIASRAMWIKCFVRHKIFAPSSANQFFFA